jgi:very-short-patch-repair endonuclease
MKYNIIKDDLVKYYIDNQESSMEIAKNRYHCSTATVKLYLDKFGIKARDAKEAGLLSYKHGKAIWNKGLTKDNSDGVARIASGRKKYLSENQLAMNELKRNLHTMPEILAMATDEERQAILSRKKENHNIAMKSDETRAKLVDKRALQEINYPEVREKRRIAMTNLHKDIELHDRIVKSLNDGRDASWESQEGRDKRIKALYKTWENPETKAKRISASLKGNRIRPTSIEQTIIEVINEYKLPYKYVGNGAVIIEGKNPDFINTDGIKTIIECYGQYWHEAKDQAERIEYFAKYGYKTLVLWDADIDDRTHKQIYKRIKDFTDKCIKDLPLEIHLPMSI